MALAECDRQAFYLRISFRPLYSWERQSKHIVDGIAVYGTRSVPAHPVSHGCARVTIHAMNFTWENGLAPIGSRVLV